jgi:hypothetical protein
VVPEQDTPDAKVVADVDVDCADTLPAASYADTVYVYFVEAVNPVFEYDVVDAVPTCVPFRKTLYPVTPTRSVDAVQLRLICDAETVWAARFAGTLGGVVLALTVIAAVAVALLALLVAVSV